MAATNVAHGHHPSIATPSTEAASTDMTRAESDSGRSSGSSSSSDTVGGDDVGDNVASAINVHPPTSSLSAGRPDHIPISRTPLVSIESSNAFELSPGPSIVNFQLDSGGEANSLSMDKSAFYGIAGSFNDSKGGLQSFIGLNAPAEPKRLSALEMTFPSLDMLGHSSDSDDEYDIPGSKQRHSTGSPANGAAHAHGLSLASRGRLSSFHEYGDRAPPTSLAVLSGLISGSAKVIDRAYAEQGVAVPDIDHAEVPKSKFAKPTPQLKVTSEIYKAIEVCIEACHQLISIVQRPEVTAAEAAYAFELSAAIKVTTEAHVVEVLREAGSVGMPIVRLAEEVKMEPNFLLRVMRLLASHNIFLEMGAGSQWFANNRVSLKLDSREPLAKCLAEPPYESPDGPRIEVRSMISHATEYTWNSASQMEARLRGKDIKYNKPTDPEEAKAYLYRQMNARKLGSHLGDPPSLLQVFRNIGNGLVVDLGSGLGRFLLEVARANPHLRIELHDKKEVMELAEDMWYRLAPRSVVSKAVTFVPHDLLSDQKYPRAGTYLLRNHLVHWNDADALTILRKARAVSFNSTKLFVEESTTDDELPSDLGFLPQHIQDVLNPVIDQVSHNADRIQHFLDVATLLSSMGRKRTMIELCLLLDQAGWSVNKIDNSSGGRCKVFFCRPKPVAKPPDEDDY